MSASTILTITTDDAFLDLLRQQLRSHGSSKDRMIVTSSMDEACTVLQAARPRLVVVHWTGDSSRYGQLDRLLWTTSVLTRRTPVLVIAERYRTDQATMMYRMGVAEYISRTHHLDQLPQVFDAYLHPVAAGGVLAGSPTENGDEVRKEWVAAHEPATMTA
jgi:DNA-binding NtrC family response regulator